MKGYVFVNYEPLEIEKAAEVLKTTIDTLFEAMSTDPNFCKGLGITGWLVLLE